MARTTGTLTTSLTPGQPGPIPYVHIKVGHPRWNMTVILAIIAAIMALSLIAAGRLASPV